MNSSKIKKIHLLPNILTSCNMFCGFYAIVSAIGGNFVVAAISIVIAGIFDLLDGKAARLTNSTSQFGVEYDSFSDLVSFGMAPAVLVYTWALNSYGRLGWIAAFLFLICSALRLARFNVQAATVENKRFTGMPTPGAAGVIASTVLFNSNIYNLLDHSRPLVMLLLTYLLAFLMVSNIPYFSSKELGLKGRKPFSVLVSSVLFLIILVAQPEVTLFLIGIIYTLSGIIMLPFANKQKSDCPDIAGMPLP